MSIINDLNLLLEDYKKDKEHVKNNTELCLGYIDDFYDMLVRVKEKLDGIYESLYVSD